VEHGSLADHDPIATRGTRCSQRWAAAQSSSAENPSKGCIPSPQKIGERKIGSTYLIASDQQRPHLQVA
jgi:hypothetical protein